MSQFDEIVTNIALENEKCDYNPENNMNWCDLPMEMRAECIKRMNFGNRCRFRGVSKIEKELVESRNHQFEQVRLDFDSLPEEWTLEPFSEKISFEGKRFTKKAEEFISALFKNGEIKSFTFKGSVSTCCRVSNDPKKRAMNRIMKEITKHAPFQFERASVFGNAHIRYFIENSANLKKFDLCGSWRFPLHFLLETPNMMNINEFRVVDVSYFLDFLEGLIQKWIDNDSEVRKLLQFVVQTSGIIDKVASKFGDRIIEKTNEIIRIRMNNETTQILLRIIGTRRDSSLYHTNNSCDYCSCKIIPIDMSESEYGIGDGWIQAVYEKGLKKDGVLENAKEFDAEDELVWRHRFP